MLTLDRILAETPVFAGLAPDTLRFVAGCARTARAGAGETLFREGEEATTFFVLRSGLVALELHVPPRGELVVETLGEGDVVGWSWLFPPYRWHFDGRAVEPVSALAFDGVCLRRKCDGDTGLGYELMQRFARVIDERLQAARIRMLDVYGDDRAPV